VELGYDPWVEEMENDDDTSPNIVAPNLGVPNPYERDVLLPLQ
jgi:hypothetical protein